MASATKKLKLENDESCVCFIHNVSPIKTSKSGYQFFNATLQTESGYEQLVSWKNEAHQSFKDMEKAKTPVCLEKLSTTPSYKKPGSFDYKFTSSSTITKPKRKLTFSSTPPESQAKEKTIEEVLTMSAVWDKVNIEAKVMQVSTPVRVNENLTKLLVKLADDTATINLTVWNEHIDAIAINKTYKFSTLTVRQYNNEKTLSSNLQTKFQLVNDMETTVTEDSDTALEQTYDIDSAKVTIGKYCIFCNKPVTVNEQLPTVRCNTCEKKLKTSSLSNQITATISCNHRDYIIKKGLLGEYFPNLDTLTNDELEDALLLNMKAVISDRAVVKLIPI